MAHLSFSICYISSFPTDIGAFILPAGQLQLDFILSLVIRVQKSILKTFYDFFFFLMWLHGAFLSSVSEKADADAGSLSWPLCPDMRKQKHTFLTDFVPLIQKLLIIHTRKPVNFSQTNNKKCISSMNLLFSGFQSGDGLHVGGHVFYLQGSNLFLCHKEIIHRFLFIKRTFN